MSSSSPELSGEAVLERDTIASTTEEVPVAGRECSCTGDFLVLDEEIFFKSIEGSFGVFNGVGDHGESR